MRKEAWTIWFPLLCFAICGSSLRANIVYQLEVFTSNEEVAMYRQYHESLDLNLYVEVSNGENDQVNFTFYNENSIDSSIARIYFSDGGGLLIDIADITDGPGTSFSRLARPGNLPRGNTFEPPFMTADGLSADSAPPLPHNGVNPGEWVRFTLNNNGTFENVIDGLNTGSIRVGVHVIGTGLPDGSGVTAVVVPEPATVILLGTAGLWIFTRKRRSFEGKTNSAANASLMKVSER